METITNKEAMTTMLMMVKAIIIELQKAKEDKAVKIVIETVDSLLAEADALKSVVERSRA